MENSFIIENLLQRNEGIRLEFNIQPDIDAIAKTITAFINTQGGDLIIGVDTDKNITGIEEAQQQCNTIQKVLVEQIIPTAPISIQVVNYNNKNVILISVWEGAKKPYLYNGIIYSRLGKVNNKANPDKLSELISQRKRSDFHWERMPVLGAELHDLDEAEINRTIKLYKEYKGNVHFGDIEDFLIQLGLIQNGNITNACIVLFGKNPIRFIPQSRIRLTIYPSKSSGNKFLDDKIFDSNIFQNISGIFNYLDIVFGKSLSVKGLIRKDKSNYPVLAMREGVLNAIVHRDYNSVQGFMQISIYSDRTEISNHGGLPEGITIPDLKIEHHSILRNPDIAQICFIRKFIEMLGSGTLRMIKDCKVNKFKVPVWKEKENTTTVVFKDVAHNRKDEGVIEGITEGISKEAIAKIEGVTERVTEGVTEDVKDKIRKILLLIHKEEGLRTNDIEAATGIPVKTLERYINMLNKENVISFKGAGRTGGYYIIDKALKTNTVDTKGASDGKADGVIDGINKLIDDGINDGVIDGISDGVRVEVYRVLDLIRTNEGVNALDIATKRGKSKPTIERYLRTAKEVGIIEFKGANRTGGYYLTEKMKKMIK